MKTLILTNEQFNSAENQNRDKAIIGYRSIENGTKPLNIARVSVSVCTCEMPAKVKGKNECWRCKKPFKEFLQTER